MRDNVFHPGRWIWTRETGRNQYVLFARTVRVPGAASILRVRISASYHYELFINGDFGSRGPVHGDPKWCQYDELSYSRAQSAEVLHVAVLVHHCEGTHIHSLVPARGGLIASFAGEGIEFGTDESWKCLSLGTWRDDVPERGWALGYCEDYDAALEPAGWDQRLFDEAAASSWEHAVEVDGAHSIWDNYQRRMTPNLERRFIEPVRFTSYCAPGEGVEAIGDVSVYCDEEPLDPVSTDAAFDLAAINADLEKANAFTFDLGREHIGFYSIEVEAPAAKVFEISGAELLRDGQPWILRKGTRYSVRYRTKAGRQTFTSFSWNGFRYLHLVIRGRTDGVRVHRLGCVARRAPIRARCSYNGRDETLKRIFDLCKYTLEIGAQEHLIDCPTREQAQYWGDAVFIAQSLYKGFGEPAYLQWYLECFLHVPFKEGGQISATYPGGDVSLLDYSLIPLIGQRFWKQNTGRFYKPEETFSKALKLKAWYDDRRDEAGLVSPESDPKADEKWILFIDHPGLGWHNFPHRGIDRHGISCPLNLFYYGFIRTLAEIARDLGRAEATELASQADHLARALRSKFFDGKVYRDAHTDGALSEGASWQTNSLAVYFDLQTRDEAAGLMRTMLERYNEACRCSPYFHFYFLPALRKAGLESEALDLIKREWQPMLDGHAATTWEGFLGDEKDSLCHPWSTAPFLHLIEAEMTE